MDGYGMVLVRALPSEPGAPTEQTSEKNWLTKIQVIY